MRRYLDGAEDYWAHGSATVLDLFNSSILPDFSHSCYDQHANSACPEETYSANVFTQKAIDVLHAVAKTPDQPWFLYLAYQSVHSPDQAPQRLIDRFSDPSNKTAYIANDHRRTFAGMVTALDEGVGNVTAALNELSMASNTLIIFTTGRRAWRSAVD